ncbi:hypothetical protein F5Y12DRAFT_718453 [Xylaria sp. FL1777]|nr:hypothetical protein F5Y12DRAFT_718453 [Xylaria sp. FL1777]
MARYCSFGGKWFHSKGRLIDFQIGNINTALRGLLKLVARHDLPYHESTQFPAETQGINTFPREVISPTCCIQIVVGFYQLPEFPPSLTSSLSISQRPNSLETMQSVIVSLVAILAASSIALPVTMISSRQLGGLGGLTSPVTGILSQVGKHIPGAKDKDPKTNGTKLKSSDPLSGLSGLTGGLGI